MKISVPGVIVRETCLSDLKPIYRLGLDEPLLNLTNSLDVSAIANAFCSDDLIAYTASRKKEVLGFIIGRINGDSAEIQWLMVKEKLRRRGIGKALLDSFIIKSKTRGALNYFVALLPDKTETKSFFYKRNMIQIESFIRISGKF